MFVLITEVSLYAQMFWNINPNFTSKCDEIVQKCCNYAKCDHKTMQNVTDENGRQHVVFHHEQFGK